MIDVHCHLNFHAYEKDYDEVIHRAKKQGIEIIINVGTKLDSSKKAVELSNRYDNLYAIVGIHPHHADKIELGIKNEEGINQERDDKEGAGGGKELLTGPQDADNWVAELEKLALLPKVVGIGEIGLDYYRYSSNGIVNKDLQKEVFEAQLQLAHKLNLPIQIHNRHAGKDVLEILKHHKNLLKTNQPGMFHCFAGDPNILKGALDLGFYIGFDGNSTYPGLAPLETTTLTELAKYTPLNRMLTETDSPFLTPIPYRGKRNEPGYGILVGEFLAKVKDVSFEEFDLQTSKNARDLFSLLP